MDDDKLITWMAEKAASISSEIVALVEDRFPGEPVQQQPEDFDHFEDDEDVPYPRLLRLLKYTNDLFIEEVLTSNDTSMSHKLDVLFSAACTFDFLRGDIYGVSTNGAKAANKRHSENREIAERIKAWYLENHHHFRSMDSAAEAAAKLEPVSFRTARKHIGEAARNIPSARKA